MRNKSEQISIEINEQEFKYRILVSAYTDEIIINSAYLEKIHSFFSLRGTRFFVKLSDNSILDDAGYSSNDLSSAEFIVPVKNLVIPKSSKLTSEWEPIVNIIKGYSISGNVDLRKWKEYQLRFSMPIIRGGGKNEEIITVSTPWIILNPKTKGLVHDILYPPHEK